MKRIFHFVGTGEFGGLQNMVINISTLVKGYDYTYVSPDGTINSYLKYYGIHHISIPNMNPLSVHRIIKKYKPNIVQGHDVKASLALACNFHLCHKFGIKIISQIHNDDPRMKKYFGIRSLLYALSTPFYNNVVMVSQPIFNNYVYNNLIKDKTTVIYNVINPNRVKKLLPSKRYTKKWDCIFLGRLVYQKNPLRFVDIINGIRRKNPNIKAIMVGDGPLYDEVNNHIKDLGLTKYIKMVGFKQFPFKYLKESKILVMTSRFEGLPVVILESLLLGIPPISTKVGDVSSVITNKCGCIVYTNKDFVTNISELLGNNLLYDKKSLNALNRSKIINNLNKFISNYKEIYDS